MINIELPDIGTIVYIVQHENTKKKNDVWCDYCESWNKKSKPRLRVLKRRIHHYSVRVMPDGSSRPLAFDKHGESIVSLFKPAYPLYHMEKQSAQDVLDGMRVRIKEAKRTRDLKKAERLRVGECVDNV